MMPIDRELLEIIVCPQCRGGLLLADSATSLVCERCKLKYQIRDGIPVMLTSEAIDMRAEPRFTDDRGVKLPRVNFRVTGGPDTNMTFQLEQGTCRAIGRASVDPHKTSVFNVDISMALDEGTRGLVLQYIKTHFAKAGGAIAMAATDGGLGNFRRTPDIILTDPSLSRLHAMLFAGDEGVGVLDLVSKNGTFVNGEEIEGRILNHGDMIEMGETTITFEG